MCIFFYLITERKESKGSIVNTEGIDKQTGLVNGTEIVSTSPPQQLQTAAVIPTSRAIVHEENEKSGEIHNVSDKNK